MVSSCINHELVCGLVCLSNVVQCCAVGAGVHNECGPRCSSYARGCSINFAHGCAACAGVRNVF